MIGIFRLTKTHMSTSTHPHFRRCHHAAFSIAVAIIVLTCICVLFALARRIGYELGGPFTADSPIYWAVGRGILNGLVPYRDLFESKPPAMFLISSFSLGLFNDMRLGSLLQSLALLLLPFTVVLGTLRKPHMTSKIARWSLTLLALCFGSALALFTAMRSGEFQTESFGALFVSAYAAVIAWDPRPLKRGRMTLASVFLFCAVGFKEPFILTALAVAILLAQHPRDLLTSFVLPTFFTAIAGILALLSIGTLDSYVTIYLPEMLGKQIVGGIPLWQRGFFVQWIVKDLFDYSSLFGAAIVLLIVPATALRTLSHKTVLGKITALLAILFSIYLLALAVGTGGAYWNHHFVFAVPGYAAFFLLMVREAKRHKGHAFSTIGFMMVTSLTIAAGWTTPSPNYSAQLVAMQIDSTAVRQEAERIDSILDRCDIDRYLFLGANGTQPYGFTRHSPLGPLFLQYEEWLDDRQDAFRQEMVHSLTRAFLVVVDDIHLHALTEPTKAYLNANFSNTPWPCAEGFEQGQRYRFLFRHH